MKKKIKKLVLKKETVASLSDFEQGRIIGGGFWDDVVDYLDRYLTGLQSNMDPGACAVGYAGSNQSFCKCTGNERTCQTCNQATCDNNILPGGCGHTNDYEICRTN